MITIQIDPELLDDIDTGRLVELADKAEHEGKIGKLVAELIRQAIIAHALYTDPVLGE